MTAPKKTEVSPPQFNHAIKAIQERIAWFTVTVIASKQGDPPNYGTGTFVEYKSRKYILTCEHVVCKEYDGGYLTILYRPDEPLQSTTNKEIIQKLVPLNILAVGSSGPKRLKYKTAYYGEEEDDLVLVELDKEADLAKYEFHSIESQRPIKPKAGRPVYMTGFSKDLIRMSRAGKNIGFGVFPSFFVERIINKRVRSDTFDPKRHFIMTCSDPVEYVDPKGISGCAVWSRYASGNTKIWTPKLSILGVETGCYRKSGVLKATRMERVLALLEKTLRN